MEYANKVKRKNFDGLDPNLTSLYMNHQEICEPFFERLAYDDQYRKILQNQQKELKKIITF